MAYTGLTRELQMAIQTGDERMVSELITYCGMPIDKNCSDYKLIRMALEEGHEEISKILMLNSCRIRSMKKSSLKRLIELALEREYIDFLVLLVDKAIPHKEKNVLNNSLFYYISNINDKKMMDYILNKMTNLSGINASDKKNFELLQLFIGIIRNDYMSFKRFKKMGVDVNKSIVAKSSILNGYTALHVAVLCENHKFTKTLLNFRSKISVQDAGSLSPIHHGLKIKNAKVNRTLFSALMLEYDPVDHHGISPLHIACTFKVGSVSRAKQYFQNFSDVNRQIVYENSDYHGYTPLHLAVTEGFAPLVQLLLNYGADLSIMNAKRMSPLHLAESLGKYKIMDLLLTAPMRNLNNPVDYRGVSHFHIACYRGNVTVAETFLLNGEALDEQVFATSLNWPLYSALHFAVLSSCTPIIRHLLSKGANPNCLDSEGFTPLNLACFKGLSKSAEVLLKFNVDINIQNINDSTPLQTAIIGGHYKIVKKLVEKGADINGRENGNETPPLITAVFYKRSQIMEYLLKTGANAAVKQRDGKTALHILALLQYFQERSSTYYIYQSLYNGLFDLDSFPDDIDCFFHTVVENFINEGCDINARDNMQRTPLHLACHYKRAALVLVLLQHGADIGAVDNRNCLPLQYAITDEIILTIFINHIMKLKYVGCPLNSWSKGYYEKICDANSDFPAKVLYGRELDRMKNERIDNYFSLYDFLIKDPDDLITYTNNITLMEYIFDHDFANVKYIQLGALIQANFRTALKRQGLFISAKPPMQLFTKVPLPDPCWFNIFRYLNEEDVNQLIAL